ncbi:hypothetical protein F5888DRAFT_1588407, partial [Russula emetica]
WTANQQQEFSEDLLKVFVSAGIPWNAASDPEMNLFFNKWVPGSKMPHRRVLSGRLLDKEAMEAESRIKKRMVGKVATGQCDGWKNVARASVVATMVTVEGEAYLMRTHNTSAEQKSEEYLLGLVLDDIQFIQTKYGAIIIAWCTDDGGDGRKMRWLLFAHMPWLIILLCWAHQ